LILCDDIGLAEGWDRLPQRLKAAPISHWLRTAEAVLCRKAKLALQLFLVRRGFVLRRWLGFVRGWRF